MAVITSFEKIREHQNQGSLESIQSGQRVFHPLHSGNSPELSESIANLLRGAGIQLSDSFSPRELQGAIIQFQQRYRMNLLRRIQKARGEGEDTAELLGALRVASASDGIVGWKTLRALREQLSQGPLPAESQPVAQGHAPLRREGNSTFAFVGDSLTVGAFSKEQNIYARTGASIAEISQFAHAVLKNPKIRDLFILGGTNDLNGSATPEQTVERLQKLVHSLKGERPDVRIHLGEIPPNNRFPEKVLKTNALLRAQFGEQNLVPFHGALSEDGKKIRQEFVSYYKNGKADEIHFNPRGFAAMRKAALSHLQTSTRGPTPSDGG